MAKEQVLAVKNLFSASVFRVEMILVEIISLQG